MNSSKQEVKKIKCITTIIVLLSCKNIMFILPSIANYSIEINVTVGAFIVLYFIYLIPTLFKNEPLIKIFTLCGFVLFVLIQMLLYPQNQKYLLDDLLNIMIYGVIPFLLVVSIRDYDMLLEYLRKASIIIISTSIIGVYALVTVLGVFFYSMSFGNSVIIGVTIIEYYALEKKNKTDVIFFILGLFVLICVGARSHLVIIVVFYVMYVLLIKAKRGVKNVIWMIMIAVFFLFFCYFLDSILIALNGALKTIGVESRSVFKLTEGGFLDFDNGRKWIYSKSFAFISEHPIAGIGYQGLQGNGLIGWTPHNTYIEFVLYYGILFGGITLVAMIIFWLHGITCKKDIALNRITIIFFSIYFTRSFVGAGTLTNMSFWILIALCMGSFKISSENYCKNYNEKGENSEKKTYNERVS